MTDNNELAFDNIEHSDDWPDRTTREPELEPDENGKAYLEELAKRLNEVYEEIEKAGRDSL